MTSLQLPDVARFHSGLENFVHISTVLPFITGTIPTGINVEWNGYFKLLIIRNGGDIL
jgi:hypothetical protein